MCGIAGIVDPSGRDLRSLRASLARMNDQMAHRGPDDWGIVALRGGCARHYSAAWPDGEPITAPPRRHDRKTVLLGHRRLAIIDLSAAGHQPMRSVDGRFWIVFNGEIYNYRELREELAARGVEFRSNSDTEVLLALFAREGPACLQELRGMFAFALWDEMERALFLGRDRFGIKPLYYARSSDGLLVFASEIEGIFASGYFPRRLADTAESDFLRRGSIRAPATSYWRVQSLPPAHWAKLADDQVKIQSYWSLTRELAGAPARPAPPAEVVGRVREALVGSVKAHMVSDVPVGVFLSGGLDSTAVVAAVRQFYSGPLRTFTAIFPGTQWDESRLARQAAAFYRTDHAELEITQEDFYRGLDDLFLAMDQPTVDGANTYFIARAVRQAGGKVALSGLGGDEMLGGYKSFVHVPRLQKFLRLAGRVPSASGLASSLAQRLPIGRAPKLASLLRCAPASLEAVWRDYRALFTDEQVRDDLGLSLDSAGELRSEPPAAAAAISPFWSVAREEIERFMIPQLLRDSDAFTMWHGLELRTPFVDHLFLRAVVESGSWPKGRAPSHKVALFRAMNGFLPAQHLRRRKMGFTLPFEVWLRAALANRSSNGAARDMVSLLDRPRYRPFVDGFLRGTVHWSRIWSLYVLERFKANRIGAA